MPCRTTSNLAQNSGIKNLFTSKLSSWLLTAKMGDFLTFLAPCTLTDWLIDFMTENRWYWFRSHFLYVFFPPLLPQDLNSENRTFASRGRIVQNGSIYSTAMNGLKEPTRFTHRHTGSTCDVKYVKNIGAYLNVSHSRRWRVFLLKQFDSDWGIQLHHFCDIKQNCN